MYLNILERISNKKLLSIIVIFLIILMIMWYKKERYNENEGFSQESPFVLKEGDNIFDEFYAQIYDVIYQPNLYVDSITDNIINRTSMDVDNSLILVVSSDTGEQSASLQSKGLNVHTVFKYYNMFEQSKIKYPNLKAKVDDVENPMTYEKFTFSHVLCSGTLLYTIQKKMTFFRNVYTWLAPDGIFLLQLSNRSTFDTIMTNRDNASFISPQKFHDERITESEIDFGSFKYLSKYNFSDADSKNVVYFSETFTDAQTKHVRQNEQILYMENIDDILQMIINCGFSILSKINLLQDNNKFIYVLKRMH